MAEHAGQVAPLLIVIVVFALAFDFTNGFHDTANAIATSIATRVLSPAVAIVMCGILNFAGALFSTQVAQTIANGLITAHAATQTAILAAVIGAIAWNLITWSLGIPSSSSHALVGGLVGAGIVQGGMRAVIWSGVLDKVVLPMIFSPIVGGIIGFIFMAAIYLLFARVSAQKVDDIFRNLQRLSAAAMAFSHGQNDAQKTMGVITLALVSFHLLPATRHIAIPAWVIIACATSMGLGTATGGWRIIRTLGQRIIRLAPVNGFAAEAAGSLTILGASAMGMAVSTTHVISGSVFGVGAAKNLYGVRWNTAQRMVTAWCLTIPAAAVVAGIALSVMRVAAPPAAAAMAGPAF